MPRSFAGSAILGIEALSQGAAYCEFRDINKHNLINITDQLKHLKCINFQCRYSAYPSNTEKKAYDIIFVDPPFEKYSINEILVWLKEHELIHSDTIIYFEHCSDVKPNQDYELIKQDRYGRVRFGLIKEKKYD